MTESPEILARIGEVVRDMFDEYQGPISRELSAKMVPQWDSLANVQLMVQIEQALGVRFTSREIQGFQNLGELVDAVDRKKRGAG